jgi:CrcB protein
MIGWPLWTAVALGGCLGAAARAGVHRLLTAERVGQDPRPATTGFRQDRGWLATLVVNAVGSFTLGLATGVFDGTGPSDPWLQIALTTGFCGALTTFSTFCADVHRLARQTSHARALMLVSAHLALCGLMVAVGSGLGSRDVAQPGVSASPEEQIDLLVDLDPGGENLYTARARSPGRSVHRAQPGQPRLNRFISTHRTAVPRAPVRVRKC